MANVPVGRKPEKPLEPASHSVEHGAVPRRDNSESWLAREHQSELRVLFVLASTEDSKTTMRSLGIEMGTEREMARKALHRCEDAGWVDVTWGRCYEGDQSAAPTVVKLTTPGEAHLMATPMGGVLSRQITTTNQETCSSSLSEAGSRSPIEEQDSYQSSCVGAIRRLDIFRLNSPMFDAAAYGLLGLILCTELGEGIHHRSLAELAEIAHLTRKQMREVLARWAKKKLPMVNNTDLADIVINVPEPTYSSEHDHRAGYDLAKQIRARGNRMLAEQVDFTKAVGSGFEKWSQTKRVPKGVRRLVLAPPAPPALATQQPQRGRAGSRTRAPRGPQGSDASQAGTVRCRVPQAL